MAPTYEDIARVLGRARRREGRIVLATAAGGVLAAAGGAIFLGAWSLGRWGGNPSTVRLLVLSVAALALIGGATWAGLSVLRRARSAEASARRLGEVEPALSLDLLSAVELQGERDRLEAGGTSVALADAHVARAAERAQALDLRRLFPSRPARRAGLALAIALTVNLLGWAAGGKALGAGYLRLAGLGPQPPRPPAEPITGDVELTYLYPAHTGRAPRTVSGTGGEIRAPRGTEVRLSARSDRPVETADLEVEAAAPPPAPQGEAQEGSPPAPRSRTVALEVAGGRQLKGRLLVDEAGSYRFRFRRGKKVVAEGPPVAIAVEPDAFPEVRITAPVAELEVEGRTPVRVDWSASDDYGLGELALVLKPGGGKEERRALRAFSQARRESGSFELDPSSLHLAEGEKLLYWLEVTDNDAVSGPKRSASATQVLKIYSEAEHRRRILEQAQALWEQMVRLLADHLELLDDPAHWTVERLAQGQAVDGRARQLHEALRAGAQEMRRQRGAPRTVAEALANAASGIRAAEQALSAQRATAVRLYRSAPPGDGLWRRLAALDAGLDRELEKDVLYLESLFDKERAQDLLRLARDLQAKRRDLASLLERYKQAPSEAARRELLAEIGRMKQRMQEMARRMAELAKGIQDEHMNMEALAEMSRQQDALGGLDKVEEMLARGDVEGAMRELDALGSQMQQMLSRLERTAGEPDGKNRELLEEMRAFQKDLEAVQHEQQALAGETDKLREAYRKRVAERLEKAAEKLARMERHAREAREELEKARDGLSPRSEEQHAEARERLSDLGKALAARDFEAAGDSVRRALPALQRMTGALEDDAALSERFPRPEQKPAPMLRQAQRHGAQAMQSARKVKEELDQLFPDPRQVLSQGDQQKMEGLSKRQGDLERQAGELRRKLSELAEKAPVFPPQSQGMLGEAQGHMAGAAGDLGQKNPQRGHGRQRQALDALERFRQGLEEMAKKGQGGQQGGFPFPFAMHGGGQEEGDAGDPSTERVEIPGADAYKVPEEFRKDILEAMKQGAPEPYRPELQRYYEELVR